MGYRSEVRCLIYGEPEKMNAFIITHQLILSSSIFRDFKENLIRYSIKVDVLPNDDRKTRTLQVLDLHGDDWKWYEAYEDVQAWMSFMKDASNMELNYEFIRIGEGGGDQQDIEVDRTSEAIYMLGVGRPQIWDDIPEKTELEL